MMNATEDKKAKKGFGNARLLGEGSHFWKGWSEKALWRRWHPSKWRCSSGSKGPNCVTVLGKSILSRGNSRCKGPDVGMCLPDLRKSKEYGLVVQRDREGTRSEREQWRGHIMSGLLGHHEAFSFDFRREGKPSEGFEQRHNVIWLTFSQDHPGSCGKIKFCETSGLVQFHG